MGGTDVYGRSKPRYLRNMKIKQGSTDLIRPLQHNNNLELWLPQDPMLVLANVGELLFVMNQVLSRSGEPLELSAFIKDATHLRLLQLALDIYTEWKSSDDGIERMRKLLEATRSTRTHSSQQGSRTGEAVEETIPESDGLSSPSSRPPKGSGKGDQKDSSSQRGPNK